MNTRLKLLALACVAPLALTACEQEATEEAQVGEAEPPAVEEPVGEEEIAEAPVVEEPIGEAEVAEEPIGEAEVAEEPIGEAEVAEEPIAEAEVAEEPIGEAEVAEADVEFAGNWAMQGEGCPGAWEFSEQTVEIPEQGSFEVQEVQQNGQEVELEVAGMQGGETQTLTLEFPEAEQDTMIVRNGGEEVTLERCQ